MMLHCMLCPFHVYASNGYVPFNAFGYGFNHSIYFSSLLSSILIYYQFLFWFEIYNIKQNVLFSSIRQWYQHRVVQILNDHSCHIANQQVILCDGFQSLLEQMGWHTISNSWIEWCWFEHELIKLYIIVHTRTAGPIMNDSNYSQRLRFTVVIIIQFIP